MNQENRSIVGKTLATQKNVKEVFKKKQDSAKDRMEHATNWGRAFNQLNTELKWLNAFARINRIAC